MAKRKKKTEVEEQLIEQPIPEEPKAPEVVNEKPKDPLLNHTYKRPLRRL